MLAVRPLLAFASFAVLSSFHTIGLPGAGLRMKELQVIVLQNSYELRLQPELLLLMN